MLQDLRLALKWLLKEKAFTLAALATLALCIGANTAIVSVLLAVILEPLDYSEPDRLVTIGNAYPGVGIAEGSSSSAPDYFDRRHAERVTRRAIQALERQGCRVTVESAA